METIHAIYLGDLRTKAKHLRSGQEIITDAPLDNEGKGEAFSPTDLFTASLCCCMLTIIGIAARKHNFYIDRTEAKVTKIMDSNPRRVGEILIEFQFPDNNYTSREKKIIEHSVQTCPVKRSIHPDIKVNVTYKY